MSGYPATPSYGPMSPPPNLASILGSGGGFNVNGIGGGRGQSPVSGPQGIRGQGAVTMDPFMTHELDPSQGAAYVQAQRPPAPQQQQGGGAPRIGGPLAAQVMQGVQMPNFGGFDPTSILQGLIPRPSLPSMPGMPTGVSLQTPIPGVKVDPLAILSSLFGRR